MAAVAARGTARCNGLFPPQASKMLGDSRKLGVQEVAGSSSKHSATLGVAVNSQLLPGVNPRVHSHALGVTYGH